MGLFSSSYKYEAYAGSSSVFEDKPQSLKDSIFHAAIASSSMSMAVKYALATDLYARARTAIKYASKPDGYVRGLPEGDQTAIILPEDELIEALEEAFGEPIEEVVSLRVGKPGETFMVASHIQDVYDDPVFFPWGVPPDNPIWTEDRLFIEIPVIDPTTDKYYVTDNLPIYERVGVDTLVYQISFAYTDSTNQPAIWEMIPVLDLSAFSGVNWIQVRYNLVSAPLITYYWMYEIGSDVLPGLEASIRTSESQSSFMPVIVMFTDKIWYDDGYDYDIPYDLRPDKTPLHATTDKLLKKFAVKGREVKEDFIEEEESGEGDSDAEKWDFFLHFAIPIQSSVRGAREYLFQFFLEMEKNQQYSFDAYQAYLATAIPNKNGYYGSQPADELHIEEAGVTGYNVTYGWSYIYSETFPGKLPESEGTIVKKYHANGVQRSAYTIDTAYTDPLEYMHGTDILFGKSVDKDKPRQVEKNGYHDYYIVTREDYDIDTDTYSHTRVIVVGLSLIYTINTSETEDGKKGYRYRYADMDMFNFNDEGERTEEFRIPIHIGVLQNMVSRVHREEALGEGMCATVFLVQKIKTKWYQKSFFKWLIVIIAVILIALSIYYAAGAGTETLLSVIAGALGATGAMAILVYIVLSFAMGIIFALASQTISEEFGSTAGTLFLILATVVSMQGAGTVGGVSGTTMSTFASAASMVTTVATYANMAVQVYSTYALAEMQEEMSEFMKSAEEKYEAIADAWDNVGFGEAANIDPLELQRSLNIAWTESPNTFYGRTLNANPSLLGYDLINHFHDIALNLPQDANSMNIVDSMMNTFEQQRMV